VLTYREDGSVKGVIAGVMGVEKNGEQGPNYSPGMELNGKYVLIGEGVRGSLAKQLIKRLQARQGQPAAEVRHRHQGTLAGPAGEAQAGPRAAHVRLAAGQFKTGGGSFLYHFEDNARSPSASWCTSTTRTRGSRRSRNSSASSITRKSEAPSKGGKRISYGARAITEGGWQSIPKLTFPGGALIGCSAGFVNVPRIKGSHNAMLSGMLAAEAGVRGDHRRPRR
jgi:electron-transferring-flavoprotein dehydrogenase